MDQYDEQIARLTKEVKWRKVSTAPKDGTMIWISAEDWVALAYWEKDFQFRDNGRVRGGWTDGSITTDEDVREYFPTHWQPATIPDPVGQRKIDKLNQEAKMKDV